MASYVKYVRLLPLSYKVKVSKLKLVTTTWPRLGEFFPTWIPLTEYMEHYTIHITHVYMQQEDAVKTGNAMIYNEKSKSIQFSRPWLGLMLTLSFKCSWNLVGCWIYLIIPIPSLFLPLFQIPFSSKFMYITQFSK